MSGSCLHFSVSQRFGQCEMGGECDQRQRGLYEAEIVYGMNKISHFSTPSACAATH